MAILRSLVVSLLARTDNFEAGMRKAEASLRGFRGATVQFQGQIRGLTTELLKFSAAQAGIGTALDAVRKVFHSALDLERIHQRLVNITGSTMAAQHALLLLKQTASATGFSLTVLAQGFSALQTASHGTSLSFEDITRIFEQFVRAARATGVQEDELGNVFEELTELINQQTISVTDLVPLLKQFPGIMDALARSMGVSRAELDRMSASGELLTTVVLPRLADEMGKIPTQTVTPLTASVKSLTTAWDELQRTVAQSSFMDIAIGAVKELTQVVKDLDSWVKTSMTTWERWGKVLSSGVLGALLKARFGVLGELGTPSTAEAPGTGGLAPGQPRPGDVVPAPEVRTFGPAAPGGPAYPGAPAVPGAPVTPQVNTAREREIQRLYQGLEARTKEYEALFQRTAEKIAQAPLDVAQTLIDEGMAAAKKLEAEIAIIIERLKRTQEEIASQGQQLQTQASTTAAAISPQRVAIRKAIERLAPAYGVDPRLVEAMVKVESNFNARAVSPKGAQGLMQLMPAIQKYYGVTDPFDIEQNLTAGIKLIRDLFKQFPGDVATALTAYHSGPEAARTGRLGPQGRAYAPAVLAEMKQINASGTEAMTDIAAGTETVNDRLQTMKDRQDQVQQGFKTLQKRIEAIKIETEERTAAEDRYIDLLIETQNEVKALTLSEEELARTSLTRMQEQAAMARELRQAMRTDPQGTRAWVGERLAAQLEERQRLQATGSIDDMRLQQHQSINQVIGSLRDQQAQLTMTSKAYQLYQLEVLGASDAELKEVSSLMNLNTAMAQIKDIGQTVFDNLAESLSNFVATGKMDFKSLADGIIADLARISLRAAITEWGQKLINLGLGALGGVQDPKVATMDAIGGLPMRQHGGPVLPQRAYLVGEAGPELFVPGRAGTVLSNRDLRGMGEHTTVHLHFPGVTNRQEADAIRRSAGQIGSQMIAALERTRARNHVPHTAR